MTTSCSDGPSWLGVGAQRSGTTWLTRLLVQHPGVDLGIGGVKETHYLHRGILERSARESQIGPTTWRTRVRRWWRFAAAKGDRLDLEVYRKEFPDDRVRRGEWSPSYMPCVWVPQVAARVLRDDAPILAVLRDPVERFASAMRLESSRVLVDDPGRQSKLGGSYAVWMGMYLPQLQVWENVFGRDRLMVAQYERVRDDPEPWIHGVWQRLGLELTPVVDVRRPSETSRPTGWKWPEGLRKSLKSTYASQLDVLEAEWGIDPELWSRP